MMIGSVFFTAGLFIFGWTSAPHIHASLPLLGLILLGFGFFTIFQAALNYLIDTFQRFAASAIAANTFLRSIFAAAFPLFVAPMFKGLGVGWASSVLGFVSLALVPIPWCFYVWGPRIRGRGRYSGKVL